MSTGRLLGIQDLASYLDVPVATVYQWRTRSGVRPACA